MSVSSPRYDPEDQAELARRVHAYKGTRWIHVERHRKGRGMGCVFIECSRNFDGKVCVTRPGIPGYTSEYPISELEEYPKYIEEVAK